MRALQTAPDGSDKRPTRDRSGRLSSSQADSEGSIPFTRSDLRALCSRKARMWANGCGPEAGASGPQVGDCQVNMKVAVWVVPSIRVTISWPHVFAWVFWVFQT
ncbi:hypothetical protein GCM10009827_078590 [Dactylosporangium maewongense]|uniref:Uncharacterized protein n=1 Tax=Dactylosporangium maewongense TaxID=634393 RepID=A0ABN2BV12_9ACTN